VVVLLGLGLAAASCAPTPEGKGHLHARQAVLKREVEGLRDLVDRLEGKNTFAPADIMVVIEDALVRDVIAAQLPFDADVDAYHLRLTRVDVRFQESQTVTLAGTLFSRERPDLSADVSAIGALGRVTVDPGTSTLSATLSIDHLSIERLAGLEDILGRSALDDLAHAARLRVADQLPAMAIPVSVQQTVDVPRVSAGPIRIDAASLPLRATVSGVLASSGRLWVGIHLEPGEFTKVVRP
jgi:hypothetical protein